VWTYSGELFARARIERMQRHYSQLLQSIVEEPELALSTFEFLTCEEKEKQAGQEQDLTRTNYQKFMSVKPKTLTISVGQSRQNIPS
jgi:non-ribosomal peptide synthetase component F